MKSVAFLFSLLLVANTDVPTTSPRSVDKTAKPAFPGGEIPLFPFDGTQQQQGQTGLPAAPQGPRKATLQETSKLELIRYVSGEFAKATKSLPGGKQGYLVFPGKPLNQDTLDREVAMRGAAVHAGDQVQITKLDFRDHEIIVDINGGGRGKKRFLDHVHIDMGGVPTMSTTTEEQEKGPPGLQPGAGSTLFLEFNKTIPDLTPDQLKQILAPFLDFARQRSATAQWADTLPPDIRKAIQERTPKVGMDREMVIAAIGKPGHKVRERDPEGNEIEDWIYGTPPDKTMFVRFMGDKVTSIKQFPQ